MSRIGNRNLIIPEGVTVIVTVKSAKGELSLNVSPLINVEIKENIVTTKCVKNTKEANVMQGTTNSLINNMIIGVSEGFSKGLEAVGVGYKFNVQGNKIVVNAGYSHPVNVEISGIYVQVIDDESGNTLVSSSSIALKLKNGSNCEAAALVGKDIAEKCNKAKINKVVFDRGGNLYHGRVKALAEAAREAGLEF